MNKMDNFNKKSRKEIIERMKKAIGVKKDVDLAKNFDSMTAEQAKQAVNDFKRRGSSVFYEKIVEFGLKHKVSVDWIINGTGEMYVKPCLSTSDVVCEPEMPFCTQEELKYVNMVLDVLRGVNEQDKNSLIMNITSFHQHYMERREIDQGCLEKLEKTIKKQREGDIKKAQDC